MAVRMIWLAAVAVAVAAAPDGCDGSGKESGEAAVLMLDVAADGESTSLLQRRGHAAGNRSGSEGIHFKDWNTSKIFDTSSLPGTGTSAAGAENASATLAPHSFSLYRDGAEMYSMLFKQSKLHMVKSQPLHSFQEQKRVFLIVSSLTCCLMVCFFLLSARGLHDCPVSLLAVLSCFSFGIDNFLMAYASCYLRTPSAHAGVKFFFDGLSALSMHLCALWFRPAYRSEVQTLLSSPFRIVMLVLSTGVFISFGQLTGNIGFNMDPKESGPHQALACSTVLLVAPFFYYYSGETLAKLQLIGCAVILGGVVVMSDITHSVDDLTSWYAFMWVFVSMLFYAASVITWRLSATDAAIHWQPQVLMIFGSVGFVGCALCPGYLYADNVKEYMETPALLLWPALNVLVSFLAMWCLQFAFQRPESNAGAITAVVDSNSLVMLTMNRLILGLVPSPNKAAGMFIILLGCITVCSEDFARKSVLANSPRGK